MAAARRAYALVILSMLLALPAYAAEPTTSRNGIAAGHSPSELRDAFAKLLSEISAVDAAKQAKQVTLVGGMGVGAGAAKLTQLFAESFHQANGDEVVMRQSAAPLGLTPQNLTSLQVSRARWPAGATSKLVLAVMVNRTKDGSEIDLHLLDTKESLWQKTFSLTRAEAVGLPDVPAVNQRILTFALLRIGTQVGNGECWTLGDEALKDSGARHPSADVWGRALGKDERPVPGDLVQFENAAFSKDGWPWWFPHHTAIVCRVKDKDILVVLQQNAGAKGKQVSSQELDLASKAKGTVTIYRPIPK